MKFRASSVQERRKSEKNKIIFLQFLRAVPGTFSFVLYFSVDNINQFAWEKYDFYKLVEM